MRKLVDLCRPKQNQGTLQTELLFITVNSYYLHLFIWFLLDVDNNTKLLWKLYKTVLLREVCSENVAFYLNWK